MLVKRLSIINDSYVPSVLNSETGELIIILVCVITTSVIFFRNWMHISYGVYCSNYQCVKERYKGMFLTATFIVLFAFAIQLYNIFSNGFLLEISTSSIIFLFIYIIKSRPYPHIIDFLASIITWVSPLLFAFWLLLSKYNPDLLT